MTQYPHQYYNKKDDLLVDVQNDNNFKKTKKFKEQESKLKKCLNFLGIKDKYMLDHFYPNFEIAIELKTK